MPGSPPTSPNLGINRYADTDTAAFSSQVNNITDTVDALFPSGTLASIPAAGIKGRKYFATDTNEVWFDTGTTGTSGSVTNWILISAPIGTRRLMLTGDSHLEGGDTFTTGGEDFYLDLGHIAMSAGIQLGYSDTQPSWWLPDAGLSSQPTDFEVSGKSLKGRIRATVMTNLTNYGTVTIAFGLYQQSGSVTGGGATVTPVMAVVSGSTVSVSSPAAGSVQQVESAEFALPTSGGPCCLGYNLSGASGSGGGNTNSALLFSAQLYGYNA